ncbi:hypothetical protein [Stenotrophomonas virus Jojan60]|nr:hypothetical protein [Stenotrophomonas virus Jojan60]
MSGNTVHIDTVPTENVERFGTHEYTARDATGCYIGRYNPLRNEGALYLSSTADVLTRFTDIGQWMEAVSNYQ